MMSPTGECEMDSSGGGGGGDAATEKWLRSAFSRRTEAEAATGIGFPRDRGCASLLYSHPLALPDSK